MRTAPRMPGILHRLRAFSTGAPPCLRAQQPGEWRDRTIAESDADLDGQQRGDQLRVLRRHEQQQRLQRDLGVNGRRDERGAERAGRRPPYYWHVRALKPRGSHVCRRRRHHIRSFTRLPRRFRSRTSVPRTGRRDSRSSHPTWGTSANANNYEFCYDTTNDGACSTWLGAGLATSIGLSGLAAGTTYYWQVRATSAGVTTYAEGAARHSGPSPRSGARRVRAQQSGEWGDRPGLSPTLAWSAARGR